MSTWECLLYALVCCLGSHTLEWPVGGVFIALHTKLAIGEKLLRSAAHRTVHCSLSGTPSRWSDTAGDRWRAGFLHRTL
jgi:hypothetical protein